MAISDFGHLANNKEFISQQAQEQAVGITTFVRPSAPAFQCTVKQRYTDFQVNEILPDGTILRLKKDEPDQDRKRRRAQTDEVENGQKKPRVEPATLDSSAATQAAENSKTDGSSAPATNVAEDSRSRVPNVEAAKLEAVAAIKDEDKATLINLFGEQTTSSVLDLYACTVVFPNRKPRDQPAVISSPIPEKSKRTEAHIAIRRIFGADRLESLTVQDPNQQSGPGTIISIKAAPPRQAADSNGGDKQKGKVAWADLGGEYLHFTLYKENKDTMEVLFFLASQMKLHIKHFSFAGTKDRRGVTVQRVAVHRVKRERLEGLNRLARGFRLAGPWEYKTGGLDLGMLGGNEFALTLRDAHFPDQQASWAIEQKVEHANVIVQRAASDLAEHGFLNYYGLQRFGTHSVGTHAIGMKILKGNLKGAVDSILSYDPALVNLDSSLKAGSEAALSDNTNKFVPRDDINRAKAIHAFRNGARTAEVLDHVPGPRFSAEKGIMTFLGKKDQKTGAKPNETDFQGALLQIQRNLRLMYIHAYQSFVWNTVVGKRWQMYGGKTVEGDLVVVGEKEREEGILNGSHSRTAEVDESGEPIVHPSAAAAVGTGEGDEHGTADDYSDDPFVRARPLSNEEADSGRFTIFDVVLPLPGFDVEYPPNEIGKFYEEFMGSENGGGLDPHNMRRAWKETSLSGGYRKMMARPLGRYIDVEVKAYNGVDTQLVETDLEKYQKDTDGTLAGSSDATKSITNDQDESRIAILLRLRLGSSQYATMALRELTKGGAGSYRPEYSIANR